MWAQLAMAGLKSIADNQNRKNDIASNVITQKYSPWTGQVAKFGAQGANSTIDNLIAGYGSGLLQDKLDAQAQAEKTAEELAAKRADWKSDADFYKPGQVGTPIGQPKSAFEAVASRAPATRGPAIVEGGNQADQATNQFMGMLSSSNPWEQLAQRPLLPSEWDMAPQGPQRAPAMDPTSKMRNSIWSMIPNSLPIKQGWN